jgi:hypothetical protein
MPKPNALERYRRINRIKLGVSLVIALALVLVGLYCLSGAGI